MLALLRNEITSLADPQKAKNSQRFFKTGKGEYGYGDFFLGLTVPKQRAIAKKYRALPLKDIEVLLHSKYHEERLISLFILVLQFLKADEKSRKEYFDFYLKNTKYVNNWDLVDSSADKIVGEYLFIKSQAPNHKPQNTLKILEKLARSDSLWERRIAIIATFQFIKKGYYNETFHIAEILLPDSHDLIHKAVGWMLREVGEKCGQEVEEEFLKKHYHNMPRTMLRYAIEKFPQETRVAYLTGTV